MTPWIRRRSGQCRTLRRIRSRSSFGSGRIRSDDADHKLKLDYMIFGAYAIPSKFVHPTLFGTPNRSKEAPPHMYSTLKVTHCLVVETVLVHQWYFHGDAFPRNTHRVTSERWRPKPLPYSAVSPLAYRERSTAGISPIMGPRPDVYRAFRPTHLPRRRPNPPRRLFR